jgi:putative phosphoribosyl transferase
VNGGPPGDLGLPAEALGVVLFAHAVGAAVTAREINRSSGALERRGLATLLVDLLTPEEEAIDER